MIHNLFRRLVCEVEHFVLDFLEPRPVVGLDDFFLLHILDYEINLCSSLTNYHATSFWDFVSSAVDFVTLGFYTSVLVGLVNVHTGSREVTLFRYSSDVIISASYLNFFPSGNAVCDVLIDAPILANSCLVFSINAWVRWPISLMVVFVSSYLMVLPWIVIIALTIWVRFLLRLALLDLA